MRDLWLEEAKRMAGGEAGGQKPEAGSQRSEVGGQAAGGDVWLTAAREMTGGGAEAGGRKSEVGSQRSEAGGQAAGGDVWLTAAREMEQRAASEARSVEMAPVGPSRRARGVPEAGGRRSEAGGQKSEVGGQRAEVGGQAAAPMTAADREVAEVAGIGKSAGLNERRPWWEFETEEGRAAAVKAEREMWEGRVGERQRIQTKQDLVGMVDRTLGVVAAGSAAAGRTTARLADTLWGVVETADRWNAAAARGLGVVPEGVTGSVVGEAARGQRQSVKDYEAMADRVQPAISPVRDGLGVMRKPEYWAQVAVGGVVQLAQQITLGGGSATLGALLGAVQEAFPAFENMKSEGVSEPEALARAVAIGGVVTALEKIGLNQIMKTPGVDAGVARRWLYAGLSGLVEGGTEYAEEVFSAAAEAAGRTDLALNEQGWRVMEAVRTGWEVIPEAAFGAGAVNLMGQGAARSQMRGESGDGGDGAAFDVRAPSQEQLQALTQAAGRLDGALERRTDEARRARAEGSVLALMELAERVRPVVEGLGEGAEVGGRRSEVGRAAPEGAEGVTEGTGVTGVTGNVTPEGPVERDAAGEAARVAGPPAVEPDAVVGAPVEVQRQVEELSGGNVRLRLVDPAELKLSGDVPNFKKDADPKTGVVKGKELQGNYNPLTGPIVVWERLNGDVEVISGRHRWDLAKRRGLKGLAAYVVREADGFDARQARITDAELNILDNQGEVDDYARYFKDTDYTEAEARGKGLLRSVVGRQGWALGRLASDNLYTQYRASEGFTDRENRAVGRLTVSQAVAIAEAAPNNEAAQAYGVDLAKKRRLDPDELRLNIRAMLRRMGEAGPAARVDQMDMFGLSPELEAWKQQAEAEAKWVRERVTGLRERLAAIRGAAKNPAVARREGVDVRDERGIAERVRQLADELARWEAYDQHPDLLEEMRVGIKEGQGPEAEGRRSEGGAPAVAEGPVPGAVPVAAGPLPGQAPAVEGRPPDAGVFTLEGVGRDVTRAEDEARRAQDELAARAARPLAGGGLELTGDMFGPTEGENALFTQPPPKPGMAREGMQGEFNLEGVDDETLRQGAEARGVRPDEQAEAVADERRRIKAVSKTNGRSYRSKRQGESNLAAGPGSIRQPLLSESAARAAGAKALQNAFVSEYWAEAFAYGDTVTSIIADRVRRPGSFAWNMRGALVDSAKDAAALHMAIDAGTQEVIGAVFLDADNRVIESRIITVGILDASLVHPREVFGNMPAGTVGVVVSHNHPGGNPSPSEADLKMSRDLVQASQMAKVRLIDSVVTNAGRYYSMKEMGILSFDAGEVKSSTLRVPERDYRDVPAMPTQYGWEAAPRDKLQQTRAPETVHRLAVAMSQHHAPDKYSYLMYLTAQFGLSAVTRMDAGSSSMDYLNAVAENAGRHGAVHVVLALPNMNRGEAGMLTERLVAGGKTLDVWFADVIVAPPLNDSGAFVSLRERGIVSFAREGSVNRSSEKVELAYGQIERDSRMGDDPGAVVEQLAAEANEAARGGPGGVGLVPAGVAAAMAEAEARAPMRAPGARPVIGEAVPGLPDVRPGEPMTREQEEAYVRSLDPEAEAAWQRSRDIVPAERRRAKAKAAVVEWLKAWWTDKPELNTRKRGIGVVAETLKRIDFAGELAQGRALGILRDVTNGLNKRRYEAFRKIIVLREILGDVAKGRYESGVIPLYGKNVAAARADLARLESLAGEDSALGEALRKRAAWREGVLAQAVAEKLLPESVLENADYFHHMNLEHAQIEYDRRGFGVFGRGAHEVKRSYQRGRDGDYTGDYVTDYLTSEMQVLEGLYRDMELKRSGEMIQAAVDVAGELKSAARVQNYQSIVGGRENVRRLDALRAEAAELKALGESEGGLDSGMREQLRVIGEEIRALDPTMPYRQQMAIALGKVERALGLEKGELEARIDEEGLQGVLKEAQAAGGNAELGALMFFKAFGEREAFMRERLGREYYSWGHQGSPVDRRLYAGQGFAEWQPAEGNFFYPVRTWTDDSIDRVLDEGFAAADGATKETLKAMLDEAGRDVMARGGRRPTWIVPAEVVPYLDGAKRSKQDGLVTAPLRAMTKGWKWYVTHSPPYFLKYMFNNLTGDTEFFMTLVALDRSAFTTNWGKLIAQASRDSYRLNWRNEIATGDLLDMQRGGVIQVAGSIKQLRDFSADDLMRAIRGEMRNPVEWAVQKGVDINQVREDVLRIALYRWYYDQITRGRRDPNTMPHAADPAVVEQLYRAGEVSAAAAAMARDGMINYRHATAHGDYIRKNMYPFYRWVEANNGRYAQLLMNEVRRGAMDARRARALGTGITAARVGVNVAGKMARLAITASVMQMLVAAWNRLRFPDEDDALRRAGYRGFLILKKHEDGTISRMRIEGALSSMLSWFGMDDWPTDAKAIREGRKTLGQQALEVPKAIANQAVQGAMPFVKLGAELIFMRRLYPDIFRPNAPIRDRWQHAADAFKLGNLYSMVTGRPMRQDEKSARGQLLKLLVSRTDVGEIHYWAAMNSQYEWVQKQGAAGGGFMLNDKGAALYLYRKALVLGDDKAAQKWLGRYIDAGGTHKGAVDAVRRGMPEFRALTPEQFRQWWAQADYKDRENFERGREWYMRTAGETLRRLSD